jgi:hypothetical protein
MTESADLMLNKCEAAAALTPAARHLHQSVLTTFADTGHPPRRVDLDRTAQQCGIDPAVALTELTARDVLAVDSRGEIRAAYPFSPTPTPHVVTWPGGPTTYAMCAVDALGISAMLARPVTITSTEPGTGATITVQLDGDRARWNPRTAVVFAGASAEVCCASVDRTCGHINFFTTRAAARRWAAARPDLTGVVLTQRRALAHGIAEFGTLLQAPGPVPQTQGLTR